MRRVRKSESSLTRLFVYAKKISRGSLNPLQNAFRLASLKLGSGTTTAAAAMSCIDFSRIWLRMLSRIKNVYKWWRKPTMMMIMRQMCGLKRLPLFLGVFFLCSPGKEIAATDIGVSDVRVIHDKYSPTVTKWVGTLSFSFILFSTQFSTKYFVDLG